MIDERVLNYIIYCWIALAVLVFPVLLKITPPYGRHIKNGWGPLISNRLGWILMESISFIVIAIYLVVNVREFSPVMLFFILWLVHYTNRSFIFTARLRTKGKKMPLMIMILAILFNFMNGFTNGHFLSHNQEIYTSAWWTSWQFILGTILFGLGMILNISADNILINLRKNHTDYQIPRVGLFKLVSCPNHLGEIIEWAGFALMTWSLPGFAFALWTFINLAPRSLAHHRWYNRYFQDYPKNRKALIPFIL